MTRYDQYETSHVKFRSVACLHFYNINIKIILLQFPWTRFHKIKVEFGLFMFDDFHKIISWWNYERTDFFYAPLAVERCYVGKQSCVSKHIFITNLWMLYSTLIVVPTTTIGLFSFGTRACAVRTWTPNLFFF